MAHVQKSVFEGLLTEAKLKALKRELERVLDYDDDSVCVYSVPNMNNVIKESIGVVIDNDTII